MLLSLPPELFARVVEVLIESIGIQSGVALRVVCRAFDNEIQRYLLCVQTEYKRSGYRDPQTDRMGFGMTTKLIHMGILMNGTQKCRLKIVMDCALDKLPLDDADRHRYATVLLSAAGMVNTFDRLRGLLRPVNEDEVQPGNTRALEEEAVLSHCLVAAAGANDLKMVSYLVQKVQDVNLFSEYFGEPLSVAASTGALDTIAVLIANGANTKDESRAFPVKYGVPPLREVHPIYTAITFGQDHVLEYAMETGPFVSPATWERMLQCAANFGHTSTFQLIEADARKQIGVRLTNSVAASFRLACKYGRISVMKYILEKWPDILFEEHWGPTPLTRAAGGGHVEALQLLLRNGAEFAPEAPVELCNAVLGEHFAAVEFLIQAGALKSVEGNPHSRPLIMAINRGKYSMTKFLHARGCKLTEESDRHRFIAAVSFGKEDQVALFLECGMNPNALEERGGSPLYVALSSGHFRVARMLLKAGANPIAPPGTVKGDTFPTSQGLFDGGWGCKCGHTFNDPSHRQNRDDSAWAEFGMVKHNFWY